MIFDDMTDRLDIPVRGKVLSTVVQPYGRRFRSAVEHLISGPNGNGSPDSEGQFACGRSVRDLAAWKLCALRLLGVALGVLQRSDTLLGAACWFESDGPSSTEDCLSDVTPKCYDAALTELRSMPEASPIGLLLPYILDPHGVGTRLSVIRDPATSETRDRHRAQGVFYTPADVAEYIVRATIPNLCRQNAVPHVVDFACGSGVFLRAALNALIQEYGINRASELVNHLHGVDIDPWAIDATALVLTHDVLHGQQKANRQPGQIWRAIRANLLVSDALSLDLTEFRTQFRVDNQFRTVADAPIVVVGNPPYAPIGNRSDLPYLAQRFTTLPSVSPTTEIYPLFVELMVRLTEGRCSGGLVLPLSIYFSNDVQFSLLRELIDQTPGTWRFSFFDREPHALFGEDVKTRNCILLWERELDDSKSTKFTGKLMKWSCNDL